MLPFTRGEHGVASSPNGMLSTFVLPMRRRAPHALWIVPCLLFVASVSSSWRSSSTPYSRNDYTQTVSLKTDGLLVVYPEKEGESNTPPSTYFPTRLPPISYPELGEFLTGPELFALRNTVPEKDRVTYEGSTRPERKIHGGDLPLSCAEVGMAMLIDTMSCGPPLGAPCFNSDRCTPPPHGPGPSVYVYDAVCSLENSSELPPSNESPQLSHTWREAAREAGVLSEEYESACLFVHVNKLLDVDPCPINTPLWNNGSNHLMVDLTDYTRDRRPTVARSFAMDASSNTRTCYYRSGYDFAVPLRHKWNLRTNYSSIAPWDREFFLTVKGNLYLSGSGSDERLNLVQLHNEQEGRVIAFNCFELHDEHLLPENRDFCDALNATATRYDYVRLMNTTFGLVPAGRSPATYRLAEVMSAGAIPVIIARDYVRPFPEKVDWPSMSFMFRPEDVESSMMETLRAVEPHQLWEMQQKVMETFLDIFGDEPGYKRIARGVLDELIKRVGHH